LEDWSDDNLLLWLLHQQLLKNQNSQSRENYRKAWTQANYNPASAAVTAMLPDIGNTRWLTWLSGWYDNSTEFIGC